MSTAIFMNTVRTPPENRNAQAVAAAEKQATEALTIADGWLARHDWFAGSAFSFGDIVMGALLWRYMGLDCEKPDMPHVLEWLEALERASLPQHGHGGAAREDAGGVGQDRAGDGLSPLALGLG